MLQPSSKNTHLYVRSQKVDGAFELRREILEDAKRVAVAERDQAIYISLARWPLELQYPSVLRDDDGRMWDLHLHGSWTVNESGRFVRSAVMDRASSGVDLSNDITQSWIIQKTKTEVMDAVRGQSIEDLRLENALSERWWGKQLAEWLAGQGMSVQIEEAKYVSAEAEAAEAEAARLRDLE